jgi:hypothetical protein
MVVDLWLAGQAAASKTEDRLPEHTMVRGAAIS